MERRMRLGELLMRANLLTEMQLNTALAEQQKWGGKLGKILVDMNYVSEDILIKALSRQLNIPRANLDAIQVPPQVLQKLDRAFCEQNSCCPCAYSAQDRALQVAMADPGNLRVTDELTFRTGLRVVPALAGERMIALAVARIFHAEALPSTENEEFKIIGNSGSTMMRRASDVAAAIPSTPSMAVGPPSLNPAPAMGQPAGPPPPAFGQPTSTALSMGPPTSLSSMPTLADGSPPGPGISPQQMLEELDRMQKRQTKTIKTVLELLLEKGVFSRDEYVAWMNRRPG